MEQFPTPCEHFSLLFGKEKSFTDKKRNEKKMVSRHVILSSQTLRGKNWQCVFFSHPSNWSGICVSMILVKSFNVIEGFDFSYLKIIGFPNNRLFILR